MKPILALAIALVAASLASAQEVDAAKHRAAVEKGLAWLVKQQNADGSFARAKGELATPLTSLAGLAMLMEGSTTTEGKYAPQLHRAVASLLKKSHKVGDHDGLICDPPRDPEREHLYIYDHAYATLFLACAYANERDRDRRREMREVLERAVQFSVKGQFKPGGWGLLSAQDAGHDFDLAHTTVCQIQGLQAAHLSGVRVPSATMRRAIARLAAIPAEVRPFAPPGEFVGRGGGHRTMVAAAITCTFRAGDYRSEQTNSWLKYAGRWLHYDAQEDDSFYECQILYELGDKGHEKLMPDEKKRLRWSDFRATYFARSIKTQKEDGAWGGEGDFRPVLCTSIRLIILQMENEAVPFLASRMPGTDR